MDTVIIECLLERVTTTLLEQTNLAIEFGGQLEEMRTRLDMMKAFLADSENLKTKKMLLKTSLIKLRDLASEADDILTDCLLRDEYHWNKSLFSCSLLSEPFFRYLTGSKLRDINLRMKKIEKSLGTYLSAQHSITNGEVTSETSSHQYYFSSETIGLEDDTRKIKEWILWRNDGQLHKVGVVGMGGLGKTTVAHKVFNDREVVCNFDARIWLQVSQAFNEEKILRSILKQLGSDGIGDNSYSYSGGLDKKAQMFRQIRHLLMDKTCLIVLDDVWSANVEWWSEICSGIPVPAGKSSCLVVTTRIEDVATRIGVDTAYIHKPKILNQDQSWSLFCKYAFPKSRGECQDAHFEKLGRDILGKCGGLPLAIKAIGGLLASKKRSYAEWKKIEDHFHEELVKLGSSGLIMASLQLSYAELPSKLKQCLLCLSIYPEDAVIDAEQLIRWWVGEGIVQGKVSKTASEVGYEYLLELASRCLVEVEKRRGFDGRVYSFRIHDMVRELTIMIAEEEGFCSFDEKGRQILSSESRWIGLTNQFNRKLLKKHPKLKALLFISTTSLPVHFDRNMELLKSLRVLDLSQIKLANDLDEKALWDWISSLQRLAYLNLSGVSGLKELPRSIQKLRNLQLLVLTNCSSLSIVHQSIINLKKLIILDLGSCRVQSLPQGLGKLSNLQELSGFRIVSMTKKSCCRFSEIKELTQLRVLRINLSDESTISEDELAVLSRLEKLKVLAINSDECSSSEKKEELKDDHVVKMLDRLTPPSSLEELYLKCYAGETLWSWINPATLYNLQYLCIEDGNLVHLSSSNSSQAAATWNIEGLCLKFLPRLDVHWKTLNDEMPLLHYVEVSHCYNLKGFPCPVDKPSVWNKREE